MRTTWHRCRPRTAALEAELQALLDRKDWLESQITNIIALRLLAEGWEFIPEGQ